jgi:hypothetical protein
MGETIDDLESTTATNGERNAHTEQNDKAGLENVVVDGVCSSAQPTSNGVAGGLSVRPSVRYGVPPCPHTPHTHKNFNTTFVAKGLVL